MPTEERDPGSARNFLLEVDGEMWGAFRECSGIDMSADAAGLREGSAGPRRPRPVGGTTRYSSITLRSGESATDALWAWRKAAADGDLQRKDGAIVLLDEAGGVARRWNFERAFPAKFEAPSLNASGNEVAIETIELHHEGLTLAP